MSRYLAGAVQLLLISACIAFASPARADYPPETRNAALRYWLAFAELHDPPADQATQDLLEKTAAGQAPFDEARIGGIIQENEGAILMMQRATRLPECDWGLEYREGWSASIAYAPRARVLARLNTLYGMRLAAKGDFAAATETWLAGIQFSSHLAQGGPLIFALIAKAALLPSVNALAHAAETGALPGAQKSKAASAIRAIPLDVFDWAAALRLEAAGIDEFTAQLRRDKDPAGLYARATGQAPGQDLQLPSRAQEQQFHAVIAAAEAALREPPEAAAPKLQRLQERAAGLGFLYSQGVPSFIRENEARSQVTAAMLRLRRALGVQ